MKRCNLLDKFLNKFLIFRKRNMSSSISHTFGVSTHLHSEDKSLNQHLEMIQNAGISYIRRDITWGDVEKGKGVYDWSEFDALTNSCYERGIKLYYILDYNNPLYENERFISGSDETGLLAFVAYAKTAVERYQGKVAVWEIWNEPNDLKFWNASIDDYTSLVKSVSAAVRPVKGDSLLVAPALAGLNKTSIAWLEQCLQRGLLDYIDAVSVHPYKNCPESIIQDYASLRALIKKYTLKDMSIISGEWGYSTANKGVSAELQAAYLVRMMVCNYYSNVPISVWYDWVNDGADITNTEDNFGLVKNVNNSIIPKQSYTAYSVLSKTLNGFVLNRKINTSSPNDYIFEFKNEGKVVWVYWTTENTHDLVCTSARKGATTSITMLGISNSISIQSGEISITLDKNPSYLVF